MSTAVATQRKKAKKPAKKNAAASGADVKKFRNPYGYFTACGSEFVIDNPRTPRPWINVCANENYGFVVTQTGGGFSWYGNSQLSRLTSWSQDLIRDAYGKYVYVRDNDSEKIWSTTWKPTDFKYDSYEARYGLGYAKFITKYQGIKTEQLMFVPREDSAEIWQVTLTNETKKKRSLSVFPFLDWCLGSGNEVHREFQKTFIEVQVDRKLGAIIGLKRPPLVPPHVNKGADSPLTAVFALTNAKTASYDGDKETFVGMYGTYAAPKAVVAGKVKNVRDLEKWGDPIASLQTNVSLNPGQSKTLVFVLARIEDKSKAKAIVEKYRSVATVKAELEKVTGFWEGLVGKSWVETPDEAFNFVTNRWYRYQALCARMWAKTAYFQCSGGIGFRDQLQDSNCLLESAPEITRKQILVHAEQMFPDGTVYHWWHPGAGIAAHTDMVDDLLWLALITFNYIEETGDESILDAVAPYVTKPGEPKQEGTIYDHIVRSYEKVLSRWSPRGIPLMGEGDWNDGMSHVGVNWKGESFWLAHFFYGLLNQFAPYCEKKGEKNRAANYLDRAKKLKAAINEVGWDGEWYIRATRDNGIPLGSKTETRGKIFLNAQTWAVICGTATPERARTAMNSAYKYLYREYGPLLFTPGYDKLDETIGYLSRYAPSVRENGGVYTHAACWGVQAAAMMGDAEMAYKAYRNMCPVYRAEKNADHYDGEPYVTPGNVDGPDSPNFGRGGWTWYSGSGSWMQKVAYNWICGIRASRKGLIIDPQIPAAWKGFKAQRFFRDTYYKIEVKNPNKKNNGVKELIVDGKRIAGNVAPDFRDGKTHTVEVTLG
ncbi:MAG TPA: glycosyl transferase family 36 [Candidatus Omnitrophica bacterium]|nr:glycosyl transferase family 36 [Candidatus Omnitrophota bacterium]